MSATILELTGVGKTFRSADGHLRPVLQDVDFHLRDGEIVAGTPIPAIVPLPGKAMAPMPGKVVVVPKLSEELVAANDDDEPEEEEFDQRRPAIRAATSEETFKTLAHGVRKRALTLATLLPEHGAGYQNTFCMGALQHFHRRAERFGPGGFVEFRIGGHRGKRPSARKAGMTRDL